MTATVFQEFNGPDGPYTHQIDEIVIPTSNTDEMVAEIKARYGRLSFEPGVQKVDHISVYPDPAGASRHTSAHGKTDVSILANAGFQVFALTSHPLIRDRVRTLNARFLNAEGLRRLFVDPRCVKSIEAYERLTYKEGTSEPDKDSGFDHITDSAGYFAFGRYSHRPVFRRDLNHMAR